METKNSREAEKKRITETYPCSICTSINVSQMACRSCHNSICCGCLQNMINLKALVQITDWCVSMVRRKQEWFPQFSFKAFPSRDACPSCRGEFIPLDLAKSWSARPLPKKDPEWLDDIESFDYCSWCNKTVPYRESASHLVHCTKISSKCEDCKRTVFPRDQADGQLKLQKSFAEHYTTECTALEKCPWCEKEGKTHSLPRKDLSTHLAHHENWKRVQADAKAWLAKMEQEVSQVDSVEVLMQVERWANLRSLPLCKKGRGRMTFKEKVEAKAKGIALSLGKRSWKWMKQLSSQVGKVTWRGTRYAAKKFGCEDFLPEDEETESERMVRVRLLQD
jgi:hypothetical protein